MISVAIIGAGIGREHLDGYLANRDRYKVTAICDLDLSRALEVAGPQKIKVTRNVKEILDDLTINVVDICLPPHLHFSIAMQAIDAGKHVICEKPLVASLAEVDTLTAHAKNLEKNVYPVFQYRYGHAMAQLRALSDAWLTGSAHAASIETHWCRKADYYANDWRGTWTGENGGAVLGHAIHNHDLITCLLGPVRQLSAFVETRVNPIETEDCAAISMQMENGALVTSSITLGAAKDTSRFQIAFEHITATSGMTPYAPMTDHWSFIARDPAAQAKVDQIVNAVPAGAAGFAGYFADIADHLDGLPNTAVSLADGRRSLELVAAVYHAARTQSVVTLPLTPEHPLYEGWHPLSKALT